MIRAEKDVEDRKGLPRRSIPVSIVCNIMWSTVIGSDAEDVVGDDRGLQDLDRN